MFPISRSKKIRPTRRTPSLFLEPLELRQLLSAQLTVTDNSADANDRAVAFANTLIGNTSAPLTFTLANSGDADLNVTNFAVAGTNPSDMTVVVTDNNSATVSASSFTIPTGDSFTATVTFHPAAAGARSANITFNTDDPDVADSSVTLAATGTGVQPTIPTAPSGLSATATSTTTIDLAWTDNSSDENGFNVYSSTSVDGTFTKIATLGVNSNFATISSLTPNTHFFFRVTAFNGQGESDPIAADATTPNVTDTVGNTAITAKALGKQIGNRNLYEFVGDADQNDFYRITLTRTGTLRAQLSNLTADADLYLEKLNSKGRLQALAISQNDGTNNEAVAKNVLAGTYFIRVIQGTLGANTKYELQIAPDYAPNTIANARPITITNKKQSIADFVGNSDKDDFYKFTLNSTKTVTLTLTNLHDDVDLDLLNTSGGQIAVSENGGVKTELITRTLGAGTYIIHVVQGTTGDSNYHLNFVAR